MGSINTLESPTMQTPPIIRRALLTLSDKQGLLPLARTLLAHGIELISTGGTAQALQHAGIPVTEVAEYTGSPEMMDGRVKTLHPKIHGAILGRREQDRAVMAEEGIVSIDLVVANFYPFASAVADSSCTLAQAIDNIDIGGPALVRAAAKNYQAVAVVIDPTDYPQILDALALNKGALPSAQRFSLAVKAFAYVADYDRQIAHYLASISNTGTTAVSDTVDRTTITKQMATTERFPDLLSLQFSKQQSLRYGENPHQQAALYRESAGQPFGIAAAQQLQGKSLSYNNLVDADCAFSCVMTFAQPACVIVKHANPCSVALDKSILLAYQRAFNSDPTSAFGGIIAVNHPLDAATAQVILEQQFVEVIIAPQVMPSAVEYMARKPTVRVLICNKISACGSQLDYKRITGGLLIQEVDHACIKPMHLKVVTACHPTANEWLDLLFAWQVAKFVKSNAMVYVKDQATIGIGAGQMSRIDAAKIAVMKATEAELTLTNSVLAADAFLPFCDTINTAATAGVSCVIQPGGSIRDAEVIDAANQHGIAMIFTGTRHFRH